MDMMKYLSIDGELLGNNTIGPAQKIIISFIGNLNKGGKKYYGTHLYLAQTLGIRYDHVEKTMATLLKAGILNVSEEGIELDMPIAQIADRKWQLGY